MRQFDGVLFDFGHTLFDSVAISECVAQFTTVSGQEIDADRLGVAWEAIRQRSRQPDWLAKGGDLSAAAHRPWRLELLAPLEDLGTGLAEFIYDLEVSVKGWRPYPDAEAVLHELHNRDVAVGVVSDCVWDIRQAFVEHALHRYVETYDLSYECGVCKPDRQIFESACAGLRLEPSKLLMVGDTWLTDGGAAALGIATLILPARDRTANPALRFVLDLVH